MNHKTKYLYRYAGGLFRLHRGFIILYNNILIGTYHE